MYIIIHPSLTRHCFWKIGLMTTETSSSIVIVMSWFHKERHSSEVSSQQFMHLIYWQKLLLILWISWFYLFISCVQKYFHWQLCNFYIELSDTETLRIFHLFHIKLLSSIFFSSTWVVTALLAINENPFETNNLSFINFLYERFIVHKKDNCLQFKVRCCALWPSDTVNIAAFWLSWQTFFLKQCSQTMGFTVALENWFSTFFVAQPLIATHHNPTTHMKLG